MAEGDAGGIWEGFGDPQRRQEGLGRPLPVPPDTLEGSGRVLESLNATRRRLGRHLPVPPDTLEGSGRVLETLNATRRGLRRPLPMAPDSPCPPGGLSLAVEGPSKAEITCQDNKDGTCTVSYLPTAPGDYNIIVRFDDKHIPGSPFTAKITGEMGPLWSRGAHQGPWDLPMATGIPPRSLGPPYVHGEPCVGLGVGTPA